MKIINCCRRAVINLLCSKPPKQPRSFLRTSLRVDMALPAEPEAAWTCRRRRRRAEAAIAVAAGTNEHAESADPTDPRRWSTRPDISRLSNNVPLVKHNHGRTNHPMSNTAPINCLANESTGPSTARPSDGWTNRHHEIHPQAYWRIPFQPQDLPIHDLSLDDGHLTSPQGGNKSSHSWMKERKQKIHHYQRHLKGPLCSSFLFCICVEEGEKNEINRNCSQQARCPSSSAPCVLMHHQVISMSIMVASTTV